MKSPPAAFSPLATLVAACGRQRLITLLLAAVLAAASLTLTIQRLGVTTDTGGLFDASLPWKQRSAEIATLFPQNDKLIVAVIDSPVPEAADATAAGLAAALSADHQHFTTVRRPDAIPYLHQNAFLLIGLPDLRAVLDRTIDAQPFLGQLTADPSMRGLFSALGLVVQAVQHMQDISAVSGAMEGFHTSLAAAAAGHPTALSWQKLLGGKLVEQQGRFRFVLIKPVLDYSALQPGGVATEIARHAAENLPYVKDHEARVRFTGQIVLDDEEFATVAQGAVAGLIASFLLVLVWLYLALRSWRLIIPVVGTLLFGLLLTTGFAALAIGTLNLISVAFAVLFVGIAVDFAIQFAVRFRELRNTLPDMGTALRETGARAGVQILVASLATAAGFLAFAPTDFKGVAQLGQIAGVGMLIAFACTLTFLPALLSLCHPASAHEEVGFAAGHAIDDGLKQHRKTIVAAFVLLAAGGAAVAPRIPFDGDPLHTKDQTTESVRTLHDLAEDHFTNPSNIQAVLPNLDAARATAKLYAALPRTQLVLTMDSFLPTDQTQKLAAIEDAESILGATITAPVTAPPVTAADLRASAEKLAAAIDTVAAKLPPKDTLRTIGDDVRRLAKGSDANLLATNAALTVFLQAQLDSLRTALSAKPVTLADIPPELRDDWLLPDGRARVQALPRNGTGEAAMQAWVQAALKTVPRSSGSAVYIYFSTRIVIEAFLHAAAGALAAIAIILALALRRVTDVALVMAPLLMGSLLTALVLSLSGGNLNFANVIALPLLLGVGVSFNIYFVMNWRAGVPGFIATPTARAVVFSALTTGTAFGSLAASRHPGTASMGFLLLISLGCTLLASLVFSPALLSMVTAKGK